MPNERDDGYLTKDEWIKIGDLTRQCADSCRIDPKFYSQYDVKKVCVTWTAEACWRD